MVPGHWVKVVGPSAPPENYPLHLWIKVHSYCIQDLKPIMFFLQTLIQRYYFIEKVMNLGREKLPTYWLGAFFNPLVLLAILKQVGNSLLYFVVIFYVDYFPVRMQCQGMFKKQEIWSLTH